MAEWSELAILMRQIHKDAKLWRAKIVNGELVTDSVAIYSALVESKPTKPEVKGPAFEGMAANYQSQLDAFLAAEDIDLAKSAYNNLVGACISCHQSYCPGPVKTIKKLYVPES
jgi:cytochrome c556